MKRKIRHGLEAREYLLRGVNGLADAVAATLGPRGRGCMIAHHVGRPVISHKGLEVARSIDFPDVCENSGALLMRRIAEQAAEEAGDGSTTAVVLARSIVRSALKNIAAGANPVFMRKGAEKALALALSELKRASVAISSREDIVRLASVASGDSELGELIASALEAVNYRGTVSVKASGSNRCYVEHEDGMCFDRGYNSPYMSTDTVRMEAVLNDAYILLCDGKLKSIDQILPLLNEVSLSSAELLIIAEDLSEPVLTSLLSNLAQKTIKVCAVKTPGFGLGRRSYLEDIAAFTGTSVFGDELSKPLRRLTMADCGRAKRVRATRDSCYISGGGGSAEARASYVERLRHNMELDLNLLEKERLAERIANLTDGSAVIRIGANTETERLALSEKAEAALCSARLGLKSGVLPGGGVAYLRLIPQLIALRDSLEGDEALGVSIVTEALSEPFKAIVKNAGYDASAALGRVLEGDGGFGFDVEWGEYRDLFEAGITDPARMLMTALEKAASAASLSFTVEGMVLIDAVRLSPPPVPDNIHVDPSDFV